VSSWRLTVRHGPDVARDNFEDLAEALEELRRRAEEVRAERPLEKVASLRDFEPSAQVHARLEISTGGLLRRRDAGVDVMGDGSLVPFAGGVRRRPLEVSDGQSPYEAIGAALEGDR
jgi:hypothetical protein